MQQRIFRTVFALILAVAAIATTGHRASAQTELDLYGGLWIPILPDYRAGSVVAPGGTPVLIPDLFRDDQSDVGGQIGLRGMYRFHPTRTMLEFDLNLAGVDSMGSRRTFTDGGAGETIWLANLTGTNFISTADGESATFSLNSDVLHYSEYIGLRDRFDLCRYGLGTVDLGCGFSHMAFLQDHTLDALISSGVSGQYDEDVDNNYYGVDIRSTTTRAVGRRVVKFDLNFGIYDLDGDYEGVSRLRNAGGAVVDTATVVDSISETAFTLDLGVRVETCCNGVLIRPGVNFKYISDMVSINHPQTNVASIPVSLTTDDAYVVGLNVEALF